MKLVLPVAVSALALVPAWTCAAQPAAVAASALPAPSEAPRMGSWGFDLSGRDAAGSPATSLFHYANGGYLKRTEIPPDRSRFGAFDALNELSVNRMRAVAEAAAQDASGSGESAQISALYRSFMDEALVEKRGAAPLRQPLSRIKAARDRGEIARLMGSSVKGFGGSFFTATIYDDAKDPMNYAVYLGQAGLGLPDRDYYLEPRFAPQKAAYESYVAATLKRIGWPASAAAAKAIVAMETEIARVSWTRTERRDDEKTYNPYSVVDLAAYAPAFPWTAFLEAADLGGVKRVIASENSAFPKIAQIFAAAPVETLKAWMAYNLADNAAPYLSREFDQAHYAFHDKTLSGQLQQRPRWKRAVKLVDEQIGEALGKAYVAAYFPPDSKAKMERLVEDIRTAMGRRIDRVTWMSPQTKAKAQAKLAKFTVKIGYPEKWRDYSDLTLRPDDLYGNVERSVAFDWAYRVGRMGEPVDRSEWGMTPPTINAYYSSTKNEIVFPAAILQPPFFDPDGDPAVNYGAIGGVIGHEITHGFDDQGRKSDGDGRLTDWWTSEDAARFQAEAAKLGKQYAAVEVLPGAHINGDLTMGENIADLGGLLLALDAYHISLSGAPAPVLDGFTGDQRVMLGWAQVWRSKSREDSMRKQLVSDPHSPPQWRVDLPVRNIDAFYEAFGVKPGSPMYVPPEARARIW